MICPAGTGRAAISGVDSAAHFPSADVGAIEAHLCFLAETPTGEERGD